ncbi:uncharacterized protein LOC124196763 [Daphnia pulex]|uniref:uncharacterized protein LOC124196763 n=1 Tax=Daphnia pulex TaxID=6669 RepID=UPI001EE10E0B|nr:uncharacterized protein LOC124196763 [Daphnia pulex]
MKFGFRWIRRWVRSRSSPIPVDKAELWEKRIAFAYFFFAWNLLAVVGYQYLNADKLGIKIDTEETLAEKLIRKANMQNVTFYRMKNLSYEGKRNVDAGELEEKHKQRLEALALAEKHKEGFEELEKSELE